MKNNNETLHELFENDSVTLPESLSETKIVEKIKSEQITQERKKIRVFPKIIAAGVAAAVVITCVSFYPKQKPVNTELVQGNPDISSVDYKPIDLGFEKTNLSQFQSKRDIENYFKNILKNSKRSYAKGEDLLLGGLTAQESANSYKVDAMATGTSFDLANGYGKTNTQVDGVDEADIIKNDGRYIYTIEHNRLSILDTTTMTLAYQEDIQPEDKDFEYQFASMYVSDNRLVLTGNLNQSADHEILYGCIDVDSLSGTAVSIVYDTSDKTDLKKINLVTQDGYSHTSRMVGSVLYTVSQYNVPLDENVKNNCVPNVNGKEIEVGDIYMKDAEDEVTSYIVLTAYDTAVPNGEIGKVSLLGTFDEIYCTQDTMFVANSRFLPDSENDDDSLDGSDVTELHSFSMNGTSVAYKASGTVPGYIEDQYSMDCADAFLRVATTLYDYSTDENVSSLYVLDSSLNVVGKLEDIAGDEVIKSVRFMGNMAYVVTFKNTDPLFVIDLSNPSKPKIKGQVKLPGFSEYLHPIGKDLLVGIGYSGDDENADFEKLKISLFDISDPTAPKELDNYILKNASSDAIYNPKAFVFDSEANTFGIPVSYDVYKSSDQSYIGTKLYFKTFTLKNGKIKADGSYFHRSNLSEDGSIPCTFFRGTYIGDKIYTLTQTDIKEFDRKSCENLRAFEYSESQGNSEEYPTGYIVN